MTETKPCRRGNRWLPIGSTRLFGPGRYMYRKIADTPGVPMARNWVLEHRRIWEAAHGPLPDGYVLAFKNGDKADVRLDNLELVSQAMMLSRNTVHNLPAPLPAVVQLLGALTRQIRQRTRDAAQKQD